MFPINWQQVSKRYLADFTSEELLSLAKASFIPADLTSIPRIDLSQTATNLFQDVFTDSYPCQKLPESPSHFYVQTETMENETDRSLIFFKRIDAHPDWYVIDIFLKNQYMATFLALDIALTKELWDADTSSYIPVCHLLSNRPTISEGEAYQTFKFAHFMLLYALTYCQ